MKALAILSIGINLALAGYVAMQFRESPEPVRQQAASGQDNNTKSSFIARRPTGPRVETLVLSNVVASDFSWRKVESDDYRPYIANLRAISCPEETIRDIIIADVDKLYARKLTPLRKPPAEFKFWTTGESFSRYDQSPEYYKAQSEFGIEKSKVLKELLGADYQKEMAKEYGWGETKDPLEHLPQETRDKVAELNQKFALQRSEIHRKAKGHIDSATQDELRALPRKLHDDLAAVLSPADLFDFEVRTSDLARNMKYNELQAFDATEEEFRAIFKTKQDAELLTPEQGQPNKASLDERKEVDAELKQSLGEDRYKEYQRAQDGDYQNLLRLAESRGMERTAVDQIYQLKDEAQKAASEVRRNTELSAEQRSAALAAIKAETEKTVTEALGERNFKTYKRYAYWLRNLNPAPRPP
ncbi:MAG TPA: hypothetical protein VK846_09635 [Candidatus Limnocylindria bacterium]|nr:hypothetical protein [Candidatus Limnocylindria bacterium]